MLELGKVNAILHFISIKNIIPVCLINEMLQKNCDLVTVTGIQIAPTNKKLKLTYLFTTICLEVKWKVYKKFEQKSINFFPNWEKHEWNYISKWVWMMSQWMISTIWLYWPLFLTFVLWIPLNISDNHCLFPVSSNDNKIYRLNIINI